MIVDNADGPSVLTRVLLSERGKQVGQSWRRCDNSRGRSDAGPQAKECRPSVQLKKARMWIPL